LLQLSPLTHIEPEKVNRIALHHIQHNRRKKTWVSIENIAVNYMRYYKQIPYKKIKLFIQMNIICHL